jgi:hypothetical protein
MCGVPIAPNCRKYEFIWGLKDFGRFVPYQPESYQPDPNDLIVQLGGYEPRFQVPSAERIIQAGLKAWTAGAARDVAPHSHTHTHTHVGRR